MTDQICRYIRHADAQRYRRAGWRVFPLDCHHGRWAMLAAKLRMSILGEEAVEMGRPRYGGASPFCFFCPVLLREQYGVGQSAQCVDCVYQRAGNKGNSDGEEAFQAYEVHAGREVNWCRPVEDQAGSV